MVGSGTILSDNSKLTLKQEYFEKGEAMNDPIRIVVTSTGNIPLNANVIVHKPEVPTFIATTSRCPIDQKNKLKGLGCEVIECGHGSRVDLKNLLRRLKNDYNIQTLMMEGGISLQLLVV